MDSGLKVHKVPQVVLEGSPPKLVDLHLTPHHTILIHSKASSAEEIWIPHSLLLSIHLHATIKDAQARTPLVIRSRNFDCHTVLFSKKQDAKSVYESLEAVVARRVSTDQLYAFAEQPSSTNKHAGWSVYDPKKEFERMGVFDSATRKARTAAWRFTNVNTAYEYCPTYPSALVVPSKISDATLNYGKAYRSKFRIPGLVYLHWANLGSITRSSQPMVGLKNNRSIQDEKLIEAVFSSHSYHHSRADMSNASYISHSNNVYGATPTNLIIDARPTTNAMANVAKGAGTENMEHYRNCKKVYLGIDNIHVMRDSLAKVIEATRQPETNYDLLRRSNWLKHLSCILEGILIIVKAIHLANSHVLVHCSDGWDRTSQLSSISQLCLDPYYRTMEGFAVLVEKDWVSYGHQFSNRAGHNVPSRVQFVYSGGADEEAEEEVGFLASMQQKLNFSGGGHGFRETCPVFDQFLDTIHQLQVQFPELFEFNETFLLEMQRQLYECKFGNFLYNSEKERTESGVKDKTRSVWGEMLHPDNVARYRNAKWKADDEEVLFPDPKKVQWWTGWFKREDMNLVETPLPVLPGEPKVVEGQADDPVLRALPSSSVPLSTTSGNTQQAVATKTESLSSQRAGPTSNDSAAVSQASTAVQGAMRSAWSAWKSVRQGYEGVVKDMTETPPASSANPESAAGSTASLPGYSNGHLTSGQAKKLREEQLSEHSLKAVPPAPLSEPVAGSLNTEQSSFNKPRNRYSNTNSNEQNQNPWSSSDESGDPLGVKVW